MWNATTLREKIRYGRKEEKLKANDLKHSVEEVIKIIIKQSRKKELINVRTEVNGVKTKLTN